MCAASGCLMRSRTSRCSSSDCFPSSRVQYVYAGSEIKLEFTHRPRFIEDAPRVRKDIDWFLPRYPLRVSPEDRKLLRRGAKQFDDARLKAKRIFFEQSSVPLDVALPLRTYQEQAVALALHRKPLLVTDQVGSVKTPIGIAVASRGPPRSSSCRRTSRRSGARRSRSSSRQPKSV